MCFQVPLCADMYLYIMLPNPALNLAPFSRWALRDKAAQRRLALRWATTQKPLTKSREWLCGLQRLFCGEGPALMA
jgi:hypothetical protein